MSNRIPLTGLKSAIEQLTGKPLDLRYRDIYAFATDGLFQVEHYRGRWYFDPDNVPAIAAALTGRALMPRKLALA